MSDAIPAPGSSPVPAIAGGLDQKATVEEGQSLGYAAKSLGVTTENLTRANPHDSRERYADIHPRRRSTWATAQERGLLGGGGSGG